ncbi:MAG: glycosyltransferase family 4 protein [Bacteroidota bacterium]|nr:glycosyltransferase family 4 protein [Bacteroidota bacterium]
MQSKKKLIRITTTAEMLTNQLSGQTTFMQKNGFEVLMISSDEEGEPKLLHKEVCPHLIVPMTRKVTPWKDQKALFTLIKIFKKEKPDIVHTESPKAGLLGMIAAWLCGVRIRIHTIAGLPFTVEKGWKFKMLEFVEKVAYAAATNIWPNSPSLRDYILKHNYTYPAKLTIIGQGSSNGLNVNRFNKANLDPEVLIEVKKIINYEAYNIYLLFVGRMVYDKGVVELIEVFIGLHESNPNLRLILLGYHERLLDPLPTEIEHEISTCKAIIHINWSDKVPYFMALSHYFVFPSHREGFPNVLLEAAAMQLPIICSRIIGNIDIVVENVTGLIFEPFNKQSLKNAVMKALQNPEQMKEMAIKLHERIITDYKRDAFWQKMLDEYLKLTNDDEKISVKNKESTKDLYK